MRLINTCIYLLIACFPFAAHAAKKIDFNSLGQTKNGPVAKFGPTGNISPTAPSFDSRIPIHNPNIGGDWHPAGNYGAAKSATVPSNAQLLGSGEVIFPGTRYPFQAGFKVTPDIVLTAASALCSNPLVCLALATGAPYFLNWLNDAGITLNPQTGQPQIPSTDVSGQCTSTFNTDFANLSTAYQCNGSSALRKFPRVSGDYCQGVVVCDFYGRIEERVVINHAKKPVVPGAPVDYQDSTYDDISPYMDKPMDPRIFKELLDKGANFELPLPTITGPASTDGEEVTTINPDGSKTVSKTKYNFQTSGNTVTNTDKSTTTTTFNIDNSVRNVSTTTTVPSPSAPNEKEEKDPCKENPDTVGCMKTDEPEVPDLETKEKPITFTPDSGWGPSTGSCPAPRHLVSGTGADFSFTPYCDFMTALRPVLIAVAWLSGAMILIGANRKE